MKLIDEIMEQIEYSETKKFVTCPGLTSLLQTKVLHLPHQFPSLGKIFMKWAEVESFIRLLKVAFLHSFEFE